MWDEVSVSTMATPAGAPTRCEDRGQDAIALRAIARLPDGARVLIHAVLPQNDLDEIAPAVARARQVRLEGRVRSITHQEVDGETVPVLVLSCWSLHVFPGPRSTADPQSTPSTYGC